MLRAPATRAARPDETCRATTCIPSGTDPMHQRIPIGIDDFRELRERNLEYVDKSHFIREVLDLAGTKVLLVPRPRRFGKTVNLSMLRYFLEKRDQDLSHLFEGLHIWQAGDAHRDHFQRYPVIHLTLKDIKFKSFKRCWQSLAKKIADLFDQHRHVLEGGRLSELDARRYRQILEGTADQVLYDSALGDLSRHLSAHHGQQVVILIDEYNAPIHAAFANGYAWRGLDFFRAFLTAGLKDNPHLFKAVLTGILRVARESIFSGLNNLAAYSLLRRELSSCFGFTEDEVRALLDRAGALDRLEAVRSWYNGYVFGGQVVYNPWSILSFLASEDRLLRGHWVATSANDLVKDLLQRHALTLEASFQTLMEGGAIERRLDENVALGDLEDHEDALWSLLVFTGYLRAEEGAGVPGEVPPYRLSIPNREVQEVYTSTFRRWMESRLKGHGGSAEKLRRALLGGDAAALEQQLQAFVTNLLSVHDVTGVEPEQVYHAFVIGLLAMLEPEYQVRSNRESGEGRPDVLIRPTQVGKPGVVLELKVARSRKTPKQALAEGLAQIRKKGYTAELKAAGASPVHAFAVAFDGKRVWVRGGAGRGR